MPPLRPDPRRAFRPPELIFELLYDAEAGVLGAVNVAERHISDPAAAAELSQLAQAIADVRKHYDVATPDAPPTPPTDPEVCDDPRHP